jgi:hypothetical protein
MFFMTCQRREIALSFAMVVLALLYAIQTQAQAPSTTINVLVLDALSGKPEPNATVTYLCDEVPHATNLRAKTDASGAVQIPYQCSSGTRLELHVVPTIGREGCGSGVIATLEEIQMKGLIADPSSAGGIWCPAKVSRKLVPHPGEVILFVKKTTWWQSHIAG